MRFFLIKTIVFKLNLGEKNMIAVPDKKICSSEKNYEWWAVKVTHHGSLKTIIFVKKKPHCFFFL